MSDCQMVQILPPLLHHHRICENSSKKEGFFAPTIYLCNKTLSHQISDEEA